MIVLRGEGQALEIAGTQAHEGLTGLELEIDLEAHVALQAVDLVRRIDERADARIGRCSAVGLYAHRVSENSAPRATPEHSEIRNLPHASTVSHYAHHCSYPDFAGAD